VSLAITMWHFNARSDRKIGNVEKLINLAVEIEGCIEAPIQLILTTFLIMTGYLSVPWSSPIQEVSIDLGFDNIISFKGLPLVSMIISSLSILKATMTINVFNAHLLTNVQQGYFPFFFHALFFRVLSFIYSFDRKRDLGLDLLDLPDLPDTCKPTKKTTEETTKTTNITTNTDTASTTTVAPSHSSDDPTGRSSFCGGSVINPRYILTAASCVACRTVEDTVVVLGENIVGGQITNYNYKILEKIYVYRDYERGVNPDFRNNPDIALLKLEMPLIYGPTINAICLPSNPSSLYEEETMIFAGWGDDGEWKNLKTLELSVKVLPNDQCKMWYGLEFLKSFHLCTFTEDHDHLRPCVSNSGSPLVKFDLNNGKVHPDCCGHFWSQ